MRSFSLWTLAVVALWSGATRADEPTRLSLQCSEEQTYTGYPATANLETTLSGAPVSVTVYPHSYVDTEEFKQFPVTSYQRGEDTVTYRGEGLELQVNLRTLEGTLVEAGDLTPSKLAVRCEKR